MSKNDSTDSSATKRKSLKSYASRVFQESSVGLVSSVAQTGSKRRKILKLLALIVCLTGFLYQSTEYLLHVLEYPTAVNIEIRRSITFMVPSFTFCDNNRINRRLFCEKFPDLCEEPDEVVCHKYPDYCGEKKTLKPKEEYYKLYNKYNNITNFTVELDKFVTHFKFIGVTQENITGPYGRSKFKGIYYSCYIINDRVNNALQDLTFIKKEPVFNFAIAKLTLRVSPEEVFLPGENAGIYFSLHSPYEPENPFYNGMFMRPGREYRVFISMEEKLLEKNPYDTDCKNYTELWKENGHSGPRSRKGCLKECYAEKEMICYGCVGQYLYYPGLGRICEPEELKGGCVKTMDDCRSKCKDDCRKTLFPFKVNDVALVGYSTFTGNISEREDEIEILFLMKVDSVPLYKHSRKYMAVEVFSCIGGFIGIWLGISLLDVIDVFEGIARIFYYSIKKNKNSKKNEENTPRIEAKNDQ